MYPSLADATGSDAIVATSQIALPADACSVVYAAEGYEASVSNFAQTSLDRDNVVSDDDGVSQLPTFAGDIAGGFSIALTVPV